MNKIMPKIENWYANFLTKALSGKKPLGYLFGMVGLFIVTMIVFGANPPPMVFFPDSQPNYVNVYVETPLGNGHRTNK